MAKSLLTAKVVGGGILGTGALAAGGYGIVEHFRSKETTVQSENKATRESSDNTQNREEQTNLQSSPGITDNASSETPESPGSTNGPKADGQPDVKPAVIPDNGQPKEDTPQTSKNIQSQSPTTETRTSVDTAERSPEESRDSGSERAGSDPAAPSAGVVSKDTKAQTNDGDSVDQTRSEVSGGGN